MKSKPYWLNRAIDRQSTIDKLSQAELNEIKKIYDNAERDFVKMINEIYESYSKQTGLDISELKKLMSFNETDKFWKSMEGKNMKQYVMKNYKARITRLEALQAQLQMKCNDIAKRQAHIMNVAGKSAVNFSFSKTVYDTSIGVNTDLSFATLDERTIDLILKEKWLGSNYSERVWKNTDLLAKNLQNILTKAVMTGASYSRTTMELRDKMGVSWNAAERLVRTEMNHFHNQAELQAYEEMGVEMCVFVATLDNRTSQICQELDGKKFKLSEAKEGVNYPPMHPYCRSTVRAYISDDVEKSLKRRARDENGKNTVVDNMSYSEWMSKNRESSSSDPTVASVKNISLEELEKQAEVKEKASLPYKDLTKEWNEIATKTTDDITMSNFTVTREGIKYHNGQKLDDGTIVKFGKEKNNDKNVGDWFKKNIYEHVEFQQKIDNPQGIRTADLITTKSHSLLNDQTIEIKSTNSKNINQIYKVLKESNGEQSSNFLLELTDFDFSIEEITTQIEKCYTKLDWLDTVFIKKGDKLIATFKKGN